jgi:hypothetical protein
MRSKYDDSWKILRTTWGKVTWELGLIPQLTFGAHKALTVSIYRLRAKLMQEFATVRYLFSGSCKNDALLRSRFMGRAGNFAHIAAIKNARSTGSGSAIARF